MLRMGCTAHFPCFIGVPGLTYTCGSLTFWDLSDPVLGWLQVIQMAEQKK